MFYKFDFIIFLPLIFFPPTICQRRIIDGHTTNINATFMVYLLQDESGAQTNPGWLCGGCIVDRWFVLTSAACLQDIPLVYVVAGYDTYVGSDRMNKDKCIRNTRKRVISWCSQFDYKFGNLSKPAYNESLIWGNIDIALARVHEPFNFTDPIYLQHCSYLPSIINIGIGHLHMKFGAGVLAYGWGHRKYVRPLGDKTDYNSKKLYYASSVILDTRECVQMYNMKHIERYLKQDCICTMGTGNLDDEGLLTDINNKPGPCTTDACKQDRPNFRIEPKTPGICQNDHGGPLVMWAGGQKYVVGVASYFRVAKDRKCSGPFVFASTTCHNRFIMCILSRTRRYDACARQNKIKIVEKKLDWSKFDKGPKVSKKEYPAIRTTIKNLENTIPNRPSSMEMKISTSVDTRYNSTEEILDIIPDPRNRTSTEELLDLYD